MARFFFDAHNCNEMPWDDSGTECGTNDEIEARAHQVAIAADRSREEGDPAAMVTVLNKYHAVVMTATLRDKEIRFDWSLPKGSHGGGRDADRHGQQAES